MRTIIALLVTSQTETYINICCDLWILVARHLERDGHLLEDIRGLELRILAPNLPAMAVRFVEYHLDVVLGDPVAQHDDLRATGSRGGAGADLGDGQLVALAENRGGHNGVQGHRLVVHCDEALVAETQLVPVDLVDLVLVIEFS